MRKEMKMTTDVTIPIEFRLESIEPDPRKFKPARPNIVPVNPLVIRIHVPVNPKYIENSEKIIVAELSSNQDIPSPIFTPDGLRFIVDSFEASMQEEQSVDKGSNDDDEWEDDDKSATTTGDDDDEWDDTKPNNNNDDNNNDEEDW
jgi:hypothetical protein